MVQIIEHLVPKKKIINVMAICWHGGHLDHVTDTFFMNSYSSFLRRLHVKYDFDEQKWFKEKDV